MENLLEYLSKEIGCYYLSDLKNNLNRKKVLSILVHLEDNKFPLEQWQEAASYLFLYDKDIHSAAEAKKLFQCLLDTDSL